MHSLHAGKLFEMGLDVFVDHILIEKIGCKDGDMFERDRHTLLMPRISKGL